MATKAKLKAERDKLAKLETYDLSYFFDKNIFGDDDSQNMFVYQPTFSTLQLYKDTDHILSWKSKGLYGYTCSPYYTVFT